MISIPEKMNGVVLTGHGDTDKLQYRKDIPVPRPGPHDVLIRVGAAAVNNTDINTRTAWYSKSDAEDSDATWSGIALQFPRIQGADVCGKVVRTGDKVDSNRVGERVLIEPCIREANGIQLSQPWYFGSECDGGFAQYTVVAARHAHRVESQLSDVALASFPCSYATAENLLHRANVGKGDTVLVTGASGGVGSAAVQLARVRGAEVIGVAAKSKHSQLANLGATQLLAREDRIIDILGPDSIDAVIDLVAGANWCDLLDVLRPGGRYAVAGAIGGAMVEMDVRTLYLKDLSMFGCTVLDPPVFPNLIAHIESDHIQPLVAQTFNLQDIAAAQMAFQAKNHVGKIVLEVE